MTKEEAVAILIRERDEDLFVRTEYREQIHEALNMAIKALEQEPSVDEYGNYKYPSDIELTEPNTATSMPCGDVISRKYLLDNCVVDKVTMPYVPVSKIENAPPVTSQPKIGH